MHVLVKVTGQATPELVGISNTGQAARFATMAGVEWVSPVITSSGYCVPAESHVSGITGGSVEDRKFSESVISPYTRVSEPG